MQTFFGTDSEQCVGTGGGVKAALDSFFSKKRAHAKLGSYFLEEEMVLRL